MAGENLRDPARARGQRAVIEPVILRESAPAGQRGGEHGRFSPFCQFDHRVVRVVAVDITADDDRR